MEGSLYQHGTPPTITPDQAAADQADAEALAKELADATHDNDADANTARNNAFTTSSGKVTGVGGDFMGNRQGRQCKRVYPYHGHDDGYGRGAYHCRGQYRSKIQ